MADVGRADLQVILDAVRSPVRRDILWLLWDGERAAGDIAREFDVTAPTISSHLNALRAAGLVHVRIDGNFRRYSIDREAMAVLAPLLAPDDERLRPADDIPERRHADVSVDSWVGVHADVAAPVDEVFADLTDEHRYSTWLGAPVTIRDGRFAAELEWGTTVRGHYEVVAPPTLIALRWDFEDQAVPVPGRQLVAYLRLADHDGHTRVEVHQHAPTDAQADFLGAAWSMVLGRLREFHDAAVASPTSLRPRRPKRRT